MLVKCLQHMHIEWPTGIVRMVVGDIGHAAVEGAAVATACHSLAGDLLYGEYVSLQMMPSCVHCWPG